ncbi:unnamed protein product, partial [Urochloa humidicola]
RIPRPWLRAAARARAGGWVVSCGAAPIQINYSVRTILLLFAATMASLLFRAARTGSAASSAARSGTGAAADLAIGTALRGGSLTNRRFSVKFSDGGSPIPVREPFVADEKDLE